MDPASINTLPCAILHFYAAQPLVLVAKSLNDSCCTVPDRSDQEDRDEKAGDDQHGYHASEQDGGESGLAGVAGGHWHLVHVEEAFRA